MGAALKPKKLGWSPAKCAGFKREFLSFIDHVEINSRDLGPICLGEHVYRSQMMLLDTIILGLSQGKHDIKVGKSRQLGISTFSRAITLFWIGIHKGLKGYMVFDTDSHKEEARLELIAMIESLPEEVEFPRIKTANRNLMLLDNGSLMNFAVAGTKRRSDGGTLGRSSGVNFIHGSECCSWGNVENVEAFRNSLSETFPDRLYVWESTARGFNLWNEIWVEAKADPAHQMTLFLGWWSKDDQKIDRDDPDFERYGLERPSLKELERIAKVKELYGWEVTPEQLAWYRRKMNPGNQDDQGEGKEDYLRIQEQPWTEEEMFQQTGASFFDAANLVDMCNNTINRKFAGYRFQCGMEFRDTRVYIASDRRHVELKVWENPLPDTVYVISADPAFGHSDLCDRSAIQVLKCYADSIEQVAEYAWPLISSRQFAWVIAALLGWYGSESNSECFLIVELNGPGEATWDEIRSLKMQLNTILLPPPGANPGLSDLFRNVRNYIYSRSDSMSPGHNYHWVTNSRRKISIMERLRDFVSNGMLIVRSYETVEEMKSIQREGDSIEAQGRKKDDRVMALAMGIHCWEDRPRKNMMVQRRTRAAEEAKKRLTIADQTQLFHQNMMNSYFESRARERRLAAQALSRARWRGR